MTLMLWFELLPRGTALVEAIGAAPLNVTDNPQ
jgi:hypothetical protein